MSSHIYKIANGQKDFGGPKAHFHHLLSRVRPSVVTVMVPLTLLVMLHFLPVVRLQAQLRDRPQPRDFAHEILPVIKARCAKCHSNGVFKGGLSLESRDSLIDTGVVTIGNHEKSDLYGRLVSDDDDERMPPEGDPLTPEQVRAFKDWINEGLKWPADLTLKKKTFTRTLELRNVEDFKLDDTQHPLDRLVDVYFAANKIEKSGPLKANEFLRRAKLDLLGQLPTSAELARFKFDTANASQSQAARDQLIDELLSRESNYADHWMSFWNDLLRNDYVGTGYIDGGRKQITGWLYQSLLDNKPYDQFVEELIAPTGESEGFIKGIKWRGRVNASQVEPLQFSQNVGQVFLGINMKCASCHDSFIDDWKLKDAYGLAAIASDKPLEMHRCDVPTGEIAKSKFVFPSVGDIDPGLDRNERLKQLANLLTSKKNGRFARTIVNRIWHRLMGRGLVHPVDVMANEAWSEDVLDYLAIHLIENDYDLKQTIRLIATSKIYASESIASNSSDNQAYQFRGVQPKRLTAEQFVDAVWELTGAGPSQTDAKVFTGIEAEATGKWIWKDDRSLRAPAGEIVRFRYQFELNELPTVARSVTTCDNEFTMFVNGKRVASGKDWSKPAVTNIRPQLVQGKNTILIRAINRGDAPNPAALFCEIVIKAKNGNAMRIATGDSWDWTRQKTDNSGNVKNGKSVWQQAVIVENAGSIYKSALPNIRQAIGMHEQQGSMQVRASLVKSDALMRSMGRPNREQVVTTRPAELSTLQALDLTNGEVLTGWLRQGAQLWLNEQKHQGWSNKELVTNLFVEALSRTPTKQEIALIEIRDDGDTKSQLEDLLWMITLLPEFQFVR